MSQTAFYKKVTGTEAHLYASWGSDKDHIYAVGERGTILEGNIEQLENLYPSFDRAIATLLKLESNRVAAISRGAEVAVGIEDDWQIVAKADLDSFQGVGAVGTRADDILIGGNNTQVTPSTPIPGPILLHFDGQTFKEVDFTILSDVGTSNALLAEFTQVGDEVFALCRHGEVLRREGTVFRSLAPQSACSLDPEPTNAFLIWTISEINIRRDDLNNLFVWGWGSRPSRSPATTDRVWM